jgi:hypothetical protein
MKLEFLAKVDSTIEMNLTSLNDLINEQHFFRGKALFRSPLEGKKKAEDYHLSFLDICSVSSAEMKFLLYGAN